MVTHTYSLSRFPRQPLKTFRIACTENNRPPIFPDQLKASPSLQYSISLWRQGQRDAKFEEQLVGVGDLLKPVLDDEARNSEAVSDDDVTATPKPNRGLEFSFVLLKGVYRMHFRTCDARTLDNVEGGVDCDAASDVTSDAIIVDETSPVVDEESWCLGPQVEDHVVKKSRPQQQVRNIFKSTESVASYICCSIGGPI